MDPYEEHDDAEQQHKMPQAIYEAWMRLQLAAAKTPKSAKVGIAAAVVSTTVASGLLWRWRKKHK